MQVQWFSSKWKKRKKNFFALSHFLFIYLFIGKVLIFPDQAFQSYLLLVVVQANMAKWPGFARYPPVTGTPPATFNEKTPYHKVLSKVSSYVRAVSVMEIFWENVALRYSSTTPSRSTKRMLRTAACLGRVPVFTWYSLNRIQQDAFTAFCFDLRPGFD